MTMIYPNMDSGIARRFQEDGFVVVPNAVPQEDLSALEEVAEEILRRKHEWARDWDWRRGEDLENRSFRIVQCGVSGHFPWVKTSPFRRWAARFASELMQQSMVFWYDQFLGKPPGRGAATPWHQDEAYWGRNMFDQAITCWMSLHDVDVESGCMHFEKGGHKKGLYTHRNDKEMASDLLQFDMPKKATVIPCPLKAGSVTFHHSKTPHMTTANVSKAWRLTLAQHFCAPETEMMEKDHYDWRVQVNQNDGKRLHANTQAQEQL